MQREEPGDNAFVLRVMEDVSDDRADAVINAEAGFVPGVEGEEDGVGGEEVDAFGEGFAEDGGLEGVRVGGVVVEEASARLVEGFEGGGAVKMG